MNSVVKVAMVMRAMMIRYAANQRSTKLAGKSMRARLQRKAVQCSTALAVLLLCAIPAHAQSTGTVIPAIPGQYFDNSGNPCSGCLLSSFTAGTSTPLSTYSDSALSVANANPTVLDSAGRATIFLTAASYKFILKTAAGATIWTRDNVAAIPYTTIASSFNSTCDGRLTLTTATPVTSSDVTAATTIYWSPYRGNRCALYDGAQWNLSSFTEKSIALGVDAANTNYDVFLYLSAGAVTVERVAWSTDTARATSIVLQDGVYVKSSDTTHRYLGTYRTTAAAGQTEDSVTKRFVWNYYNRVRRILRVTEATDTWTYTTATLRQVRASTANQVAVVVGVAETVAQLRASAIASNTSANVSVVTAIGFDSTSAAAATNVGMFTATQVVNTAITPIAFLTHQPTIGYHFYAWLEWSAATGTTTWSGDGGSPTVEQAGLDGFIDG
jgi:hypothetical protein